MPLLTKKTFGIKKPISRSQPLSNKVKNKDGVTKFKTPLLAKENIEQILRDSSPQPSYSAHKKNVFKSTEFKKTKSNLSIKSVHLSFESTTSQKDSQTTPNLSLRMNDPQIKEAYLQFVKRLSQSSNKDNVITSSPVSEKLKDNNILLAEKSVNEEINKKINSIKAENKNKKTQTAKRGIFNKQISNDSPLSIKTPIETQRSQETNKPVLSLDSGLSLSKEVLNSEEVKAAYLKFVENQVDDDEDDEDILKFIMKGTPKQKKRRLKSSSSEESLKKPVLKKKGKKVRRIISDEDEDISHPRTETNKSKKEIKHATDSTQKISGKLKTKPKKETKSARKSTTNKNKTTNEDAFFSILTLEEKMAIIHESRDVGLYVLCDICDKARYLPHVKDPLDLPDKWYCAMNPDESHNKCSDPEEVEEDENYLVHNLYNSGSIVWAKMDGFPWWPAMVEDDPDTADYFWLEGDSMTPTWYHVTFFDSQEVTRAWMRPSNLKPFKINMKNPMFHKDQNKYKSRIRAAFEQARDAAEMPLLERLEKYSFIKRYKRASSKKPVKEHEEKKTSEKENISPDLFLDYDTESLRDDPSMVSINTFGNRASKGNKIDDFSIEFNNINWIGNNQDLSFNLLE